MEEKKSNRLIIFISVVVPLAVAALFGVKVEGYDFGFLPPIYATVNAMTAVLLIASVIAIKNKKIRTHRYLMNTCLGLSALFLLMYIAYHITSEPTGYGGEWKYFYYFILITHITLSVAVIPLVLFTYARAINGDFKKHKKLAKITFPVWLYVAVTGVLVYVMISPYY